MPVGSVSVDVLSNKLPQVRSNFPVILNAILRKATNDVYSRSQLTVPVRRNQKRVRGGALKMSGQVTYSNFEGTVRYNIYYAVYVHEGTYRMPARPFLDNALNAVQPALIAALGSLENRLL